MWSLKRRSGEKSNQTFNVCYAIKSTEVPVYVPLEVYEKDIPPFQ